MVGYTAAEEKKNLLNKISHKDTILIIFTNVPVQLWDQGLPEFYGLLLLFSKERGLNNEP